MASTSGKCEAASASSAHHVEQHLGVDVHTVHSAHAALESAEHVARIDKVFAAVISRSLSVERISVQETHGN